MSVRKIIEKYENDSLENVLRKLYIDEDLSIDAVAKKLCISAGAVHSWLHEFSISKQENLWNFKK